MSKKPTVLDHFIKLAKERPTSMLFIVKDSYSINKEMSKSVLLLAPHFSFITVDMEPYYNINIPFMVQPIQQYQSRIKFKSFVEIKHNGIRDNNWDLIATDDRVQDIIRASSGIIEASRTAYWKREGKLPSTEIDEIKEVF
ncbi:hypothetical protein DSECCO2_414040 [anaerobic digester metagenome]